MSKEKKRKEKYLQHVYDNVFVACKDTEIKIPDKYAI